MACRRSWLLYPLGLLAGCAALLPGADVSFQEIAFAVAPEAAVQVPEGMGCIASNDRGSWHFQAPGAVRVKPSMQPLQVMCHLADGASAAMARIRPQGAQVERADRAAGFGAGVGVGAGAVVGAGLAAFAGVAAGGLMLPLMLEGYAIGDGLGGAIGAATAGSGTRGRFAYPPHIILKVEIRRPFLFVAPQP
ncbi:hypothetical protein ACT80S_00965 [Ramlibacter sp. MAHUQ-53]|uniref:hypothetical protein n=1 Tax=unclassified Ramlibacter TaxID=2617605 RepID=UPI00363FFF0B